MLVIEDVSTYGGQIDTMYLVVLIFTGIAFFVVEGLLIYFLIRYRYREGHKARYIHGNHRVELIWTIVPGLFMFALAIFQYSAWTQIKIDIPAESDSFVMRVEAEQFEWYPIYPGPDGQLDTGDDIEGPANQIHVPVNKPVIVHLTARDTLHSFFLPNLRIKQDAIPGTTIPVWFEAVKTGEYEIVCAELCGLGHYRMRGFLTVESEADVQAWLDEIASK